MISDQGKSDIFGRAADDFARARRAGRLRRLWANLTGQSNHLIPFEDLRKSLGATEQGYRGLRPVRLDRIIGSLGRSRDFDRAFLPTQTHSRRKWLSVHSAYLGGITLPAVSLYKVGEAYFVVDGHHRISVARQQGQTFIDAEVVEVPSSVPVTSDLKLEDLDTLRAYRDFLRETKLDKLRPDQDIRLTMPGDYVKLKEHIDVHKYLIETSEKREFAADEAVTHWYDHVYMPVIKAIRKRKLMSDFPGRSEADLYLWIIDHAYYLSQEIGHELAPLEVVRDYVSRFGRRPKRLWGRLRASLFKVIIPDEIQPGPPAGTWRHERVEPREESGLFRDVLMTVTGAETGWLALDQVAEIARREASVLRGLHVMPTDTEEARTSGQSVLQEFSRRCAKLELRCTTSLVQGDPSQRIIERARWADMVVINQRRVHGRWAERPLGTIFQTVAAQVARPILAVPGAQVQPIRHAVLAYDGSPKAREALFVLKHMLKHWDVEATVLTVEDAGTHNEMLQDACKYLNLSGCSSVGWRYTSGATDQAILRIMGEENADLLLMGGYGYKPLLKAFLGSTVNRILREAWFPVLICR